MTGVVLPERLPGPDGLLLRRWLASDAEALGQAILESADHLRPWMEWIAGEPLPLDRRVAMINEWERDWAQGGDVLLGVFVDGRIAGGGGLHRRIGADGLEIGYWTHVAFLRRGVAKRAARVLTDAGLAVPGITRMEIHHDKANEASAGVPRALGFEWLGESPDEPVAPDEAGVECRWRMGKEAWEVRRAANPPGHSGPRPISPAIEDARRTQRS
jgi:RimJ/RimL family protein N-acetyltransferase